MKTEAILASNKSLCFEKENMFVKLLKELILKNNKNETISIKQALQGIVFVSGN